MNSYRLWARCFLIVVLLAGLFTIQGGQVQAAGLGTVRSAPAPAVIFTYVPPYETPISPSVPGVDLLKGWARNVSPYSAYYIVCFIYVPETGAWWIKPYWNSWQTPIDAIKGSWGCDITTGGLDDLATIVEAYLVPKTANLPDPPTRGDVAAVAVAKARAPRTNLHIRDRYLLSANNVNFVMRGINHMHTWFPEQTNALQHIKAKGANAVRVVLSSGHVPGWTKNSASDVANVIKSCKANRLICVLEVHDTIGYGESPDAISLAQAVSYWKEIRRVLIGQESYIILNIGNEPYGNTNVQNWIPNTKNAIKAMRAAGFRHVLMVDAPNWGQDWQFVMRDNAASVLASDPHRNTMFSIHMYGVFDTPEAIEAYLLRFVRAKLPLVIGEFGHLHSDGDPDEDAILRLARKYGIGYLGWAWSGNCCGGEYLDMVTDFDPALETPWGNRIINGPNGIHLTALEASIYSGERNPEVVSVNRVNPNPTSLPSVKFRVTFSEPVTGVDAIAPFRDLRLVTTGVTGAAITSVSGSGTTYTVTVNTGSGSGTIRLDVLDKDTIVDAKKNTLGGPGPSYGNFRSGQTYTVTKP